MKYKKRKITSDIRRGIRAILNGRMTISQLAGHLAMWASSDRKWLYRLVQQFKKTKKGKQPARQPSSPPISTSSPTSSTTTTSDESNYPLKNEQPVRHICGLKTNRKIMENVINGRLELKHASEQLGLGVDKWRSLQTFIKRVKSGETKWPPESDRGDSDSTSVNSQHSATNSSDVNKKLETRKKPEATQNKFHRKKETIRNKCIKNDVSFKAKHWKKINKRWSMPDQLKKVDFIELDSQMGRRGTVAIPANDEKTLWNIYNKYGNPKDANTRYLQCRCRGVRRWEVHNQGWRLAKQPRGSHTDSCLQLNLYEVAAEQVEIKRQKLVKSGMSLQVTQTKVLTSVCIEVAESAEFVIDAAVLFEYIQPYMLAKRKMSRVKVSYPSNLNLNDLPDQFKMLPAPLHETRWFLGPESAAKQSKPEVDYAVFACDNDLRVLSTAATVVTDGTFSTSPKHYYQLFVIHAKIQTAWSPVAHAFMRNKRQNTYTAVFDIVFEKMHELKLTMSCTTVVMDFEHAERNAFRLAMQKHFPDVYYELLGCAFHFGQSLMRRAYASMLKATLDRNIPFRVWYRSVAACCYYPTDQVVELWLRQTFMMPQRLQRQFPMDFLLRVQELLQGIFAFYVDPNTAVFPPSEWSQWMNRNSRTSNAAENYHSVLKSSGAPLHASVSAVFSFLHQRKIIEVHEQFWMVEKNRLRQPSSLYAWLDTEVIRRQELFVERQIYLDNLRNYDELMGVWNRTAQDTPNWLRELTVYTHERLLEEGADEVWQLLADVGDDELEQAGNQVLELLYQGLDERHLRSMAYLMYEAKKKPSQNSEKQDQLQKSEQVSEKISEPKRAAMQAAGREIIRREREISHALNPPKWSLRTKKGRKFSGEDRALPTRHSVTNDEIEEKNKNKLEQKTKRKPTGRRHVRAQQAFNVSNGGPVDIIGYVNVNAQQCWLIADTQLLLNIPRIRELLDHAIDHETQPLTSRFANVLAWHNQGSRIQGKQNAFLRMYDQLRRELPTQQGRGQQDANEGLVLFLQTLERERMNAVNAGNAAPDYNEMFRYGTTQNIVCPCGYQTGGNTLHHSTLYSTQAISSNSISHGIQETSSEQLDGYLCAACNTVTQRRRNSRFMELPSYLLVNISRYSANRRDKVRTPVNIDQQLDFADMNLLSEDFQVQDSSRYDLIAVVKHEGALLAHGHYVAWLNDGGEWKLCNDEQVYGQRVTTVIKMQPWQLT